MKTAYLAYGTRSPFAKAGTDLKTVHAAELGRHALAELIARSNLSHEHWGKIVDEVIIGNTGTPADAANISRVIALRAGLPENVSAYTVHRNCASAMEAMAQATLKVQAGQGDVFIAGGAESMSQMPLMYNNKATSFFDKLSRARSLADRLKVLKDIPLKDFLKPRIAIMEGLTDPFYDINMGETAEIIAKEFGIKRNEQDEFALWSHQKAVKAQEAGHYANEIAPYSVPPKFENTLTNDSGPRANQSMEALAKLRPFFDKKFGSITAGNSCPITDGACMVSIVSEEGLAKLEGAKAIAKITGYAFAGLDPRRMGLGPVFATKKLLDQTGEKLQDFDVIEINEAFSAQVIGCLRAFESQKFFDEHFNGDKAMGAIAPERLNPNGGAIAIGHPVGATGARIALTAALEMNRLGAKKALATMCIGGGQGGSISLEAV
ncbi:thiolase family protein [bacterium]|nr:thiolase family protein [bacterium]